jgi:hypothetical protein
VLRAVLAVVGARQLQHHVLELHGAHQQQHMHYVHQPLPDGLRWQLALCGHQL